SLGDHTNDQRFAYFASVAGNRTDRGLERVDIPVLNDQAANGSAFTSLLYNASTFDQLRFVGSARTDHYHVPNTVEQQALGIRDREVATDGFTNFTWAHTTPSGLLLTVSPRSFDRTQFHQGSVASLFGSQRHERTVPDRVRKLVCRHALGKSACRERASSV